MKKLFTILLMLVAMNASGQWQPDVRLTNNPSASYTSYYNNSWCVASSGSFVHVVWYDSLNGKQDIYYKRSTDGGVSWEADTRLSNGISYSNNPSVAVSGSIVHVVWMDFRDGNDEIYYKRSTDAGVSWGADTRLTNSAGFSYHPSVAVSGSVVHVVWCDDRDLSSKEIYYKRSTDGGINWGADTRLTFKPFASFHPSIAISGSVVHIAWYDYRHDYNGEIYYKRSTDGGINWGADTRLTNDISWSIFASIAVSGSVVHIVWEELRDGNSNIYYKRSTDAGVNWGADTRLTNNSAGSGSPSVAVSGSVVHVVWEEFRDGNGGEIYYKRSTDAGINWGADTRLTNNTAYSARPSISVSNSVLHVVWYDFRDGNNEIYYKRNPTGNVAIQNINTEIPSAYSLGQNYPNPFNPTTKIRFSIVSSPHGLGGDLVLLKIYDIMGREVQTLVNERLQPGTYETSFDGSTLNSGVYFYKLTTDGYTETKRMLMIK